MTLGYYPGCSLEGVSVEYDLSIRSLFQVLDINIEDLKKWICCGTLAAPSISRLLGLATPLWNVAQARKEGITSLITPCSACLYHFKNAQYEVTENPELQDELENILEISSFEPIPIIHPLELLVSNNFKERINNSIKRDLSSMNVVCYYGCHISRPADVMQFDDPENPRSMDEVMNWIGVNTVDWAGKVDCCGAHFSMIKPGYMIELCAKIISAALDVNADAIAVACPMCHANLDIRQSRINEKINNNKDLPILYFSQLLGFAMGSNIEELGLKKHLVNPIPLMLEKCKSEMV